MEVQSLAIPDVKLIVPRIYRDARGFFSETFSTRGLSEAAGITETFVQDNHSMSTEAGVLRGLHFQIPPDAQDKLVRVVRGAIFDVAVDIRLNSPTYGRHVSAILSAANWTQMWVPKGFAHGYCTLEPETEVVYKTTAFYVPQHDKGLAWNDRALGIAWPEGVRPELLSTKDKVQPTLAELPAYFGSDPA